MTRSTARLSATVGAIGLLTLLTLAGVGFTQGHIGDTRAQFQSACGPTSPAGSVVHVTLADRGNAMMSGGTVMIVSLFASPSQVPAGDVTFVATNVGALTHELLVLPAPRDGVGTRAMGVDGKVNESSSLAEASTSCGRGAGAGIAPGTTSWVTLHLSPGNYELLCNVPWHYANGMYQGLTVQ
ncbi:MAG: sulfocyanin-like copper-binding protein [Acidimicrobiales bacterium]